MRKGKNANSCLFGEELVGYIYDELPVSERAAFENHLLSCSGCTAELADISISRLGVFEWHRDGFLPLATPQFAIPYEPIGIAETRPPSFFRAVRGVFATPFRVAFAGGSLAVFFSIAALVLMFNVNPGSDIAAGKTQFGPPVTGPMVAEPALERPAPEPSAIVSKSRPEISGSRYAEPVRRTHVVRAKATSDRKGSRTLTTNAQNVPRLGNFVEPEDTSLRLADLVADIDTKEF